MAKYRKKPVVIDAIKWTGENVSEVLDFAANTGISPLWGDDFKINNETKCFEILTLEGTMSANVGDWIICGVRGEFYPCKPDIFDATYEVKENACALENGEVCEQIKEGE
jgi:hypothetical protein